MKLQFLRNQKGPKMQGYGRKPPNLGGAFGHWQPGSE